MSPTRHNIIKLIKCISVCRTWDHAERTSSRLLCSGESRRLILASSLVATGSTALSPPIFFLSVKKPWMTGQKIQTLSRKMFLLPDKMLQQVLSEWISFQEFITFWRSDHFLCICTRVQFSIVLLNRWLIIHGFRQNQQQRSKNA